MTFLSNDVKNEAKRWCVYCHTSPSGKKYIGITSQAKPEYRWGTKGQKYLGTNPDGSYKQLRMARAINKYPWELWEHEVLANVETQEEAKELEQYYVKYYDTQNPEYGYNCTPGGDSVSDRDMTGENNPNYGNHKLAGENNPMFGKHHSEETKAKISKALSNPSEETRKKISNKAKERWKDEEYRKKCMENRKPIAISEETQKRQSEAQKARWTDEMRVEWGKRFSGENHPAYGKERSPEYKEKLRQVMIGKMAGFKNPKCKPVYCIELDEIFWGAKAAQDKYGFNRQSITTCCSGRYQTSGTHPTTGEKMHWLYVTTAIEQGYVTQQQLDNYLNNLKEERN